MEQTRKEILTEIVKIMEQLPDWKSEIVLIFVLGLLKG